MRFANVAENGTENGGWVVLFDDQQMAALKQNIPEHYTASPRSDGHAGTRDVNFETAYYQRQNGGSLNFCEKIIDTLFVFCVKI